jgi:NAD(P)-dependent dehydrogenase (short-subunit alcohol dehydrogenase family)
LTIPDRAADGRLDGRVALVTGAARGQGRAHAIALAGLGAAIVALDVPAPMDTIGYPLATSEDLARTCALITEAGGVCVPVEADVRDAAALDAAVREAVTAFGGLHVMVANAGIVSQAKVWETSDAAWSELVATNLTGVFHCLRAAVPPMREAGFGRIVVTSSMGGLMGIPGTGAYNATKWGVIGLAKSLALEVAKEGITVNVVCPCTVATPMALPDGRIPDEETMERARRMYPIPRPWLDAEDVTRAVVYLVTDPGVLTGVVMEIGLGSSARMR